MRHRRSRGCTVPVPFTGRNSHDVAGENMPFFVFGGYNALAFYNMQHLVLLVRMWLRTGSRAKMDIHQIELCALLFAHQKLKCNFASKKVLASRVWLRFVAINAGKFHHYP